MTSTNSPNFASESPSDLLIGEYIWYYYFFAISQLSPLGKMSGPSLNKVIHPSPKDVVNTKRMTDWWQMADNQKRSLELSARVSYKQLRQWMWDKKVIGWKIYSFCLSFIFSPLSFFNFDHIIHVMKLPLIQEMESLQTLLQ